MGKGAISQLQEFVQASKHFPLPPSCPILQWQFDSRTADGSLEFRATVAFLLDAVPHHIVGAWHPSKKVAQRDAAERALGMLVGRWGECALLREEDADAEYAPSQREAAPGDGSDTDGACWPARSEVPALPVPGAEAQALEGLCRSVIATSKPQWWSQREKEGGLCRAFVRLELMGVPHTFAGRPCETLEAAATDTAKRVLWYLQCPGFQTAFEPDPETLKTMAVEIPSPHCTWEKAPAARGGA